MMVTVLLLGRRGLPGARISQPARRAPDAGGRRLFVRCRGLAQRDPRDRLAAEWIVVEQGEAEKDDQKQAEQHGQRLHGR